MRETGAEFCARERGESCAGGTAVKIDGEVRLPLSQGCCAGRQNPLHIGIVFEHGSESILHDDGHFHVGTRLLENFKRGSSQDTISQ